LSSPLFCNIDYILKAVDKHLSKIPEASSGYAGKVKTWSLLIPVGSEGEVKSNPFYPIGT
jgi:hypothetical protein